MLGHATWAVTYLVASSVNMSNSRSIKLTTISFAVVLEPRKIIFVTVTPSSTMQGASQARSAHGMREMKDRQTMKDGGGAMKHDL